MSKNWLYTLPCLLSVVLLNCLASGRLEVAMIAPIVSIPCVFTVLLGVLGYGIYALQFGQSIDGRLVLPASRLVANFIRLWNACLIVALVAGIPSIVYLDSVIRKFRFNDTQETIEYIVPNRVPSI